MPFFEKDLPQTGTHMRMCMPHNHCELPSQGTTTW
jgi:hypothetical protein